LVARFKLSAQQSAAPQRVVFVTTSSPRNAADPSGHFVAAECGDYAHKNLDAEVWLLAPGRMPSRPPTPGMAGASYVADDAPAALLRLAGRVHQEHLVRTQIDAAFGWPGAAARIRERPTRLLGAVTFAAGAMHALRTLQPHAVVAHWAVPCAWPIAYASPSDAIPFQLEVVSHGADVRLLIALPAPVRERLVERIAGRATSWRFVSATLRDDLLDHVSARVARRVEAMAYVEPVRIEFPNVGTRAAQIRALHGDFWVSVGRLIASKRVERAIAHSARCNMHLVVVGDGPEAANLRALARAHSAHVTFAGLHDRGEALAWIAASRGVVLTSAAEGCSTVAREADAYAVPVIDLTAPNAGSTIRSGPPTA
jgi:teichuronic acid biosynthesis glycosyltransferase TuaC